ncbi:MAG: tetratricopeptide repeat protein [Candidatus Spyradosoma sp.]
MKNSDSITLRDAGKTAFFARDFKTAFERFGEAAALGDAEAQCFLGEFYDDFGRGFPVDFAKARGLYEKSLAQGFARAGTNLSALFSNGQGVPRDEAEAEKLLDAALACGDALAVQLEAAKIFLEIEEDAPDALKKARAALELQRRAEADAEFVRAYGKLSPLLELFVARVAGKLDAETFATETRAVCRALRRALKKAALPNDSLFFVYAFVKMRTDDDELAETLLREAAQDGPATAKATLAWTLYSGGKPGAFALALEAFGAVPSCDAALVLALSYAFGEGVEEKPEEARYWFDRAIELAAPEDAQRLGDAHASFGLFEQGQGDFKAAERHFRASAALGDANGASELARALFARDDPEAFTFAKAAYEGGAVLGARVLAACHRDGVGTKKSPKDFVRIARELDAADEAVGAYMLGGACREGFGVPEDEARAIAYFERADALGDADAAGQIAQIYRRRKPADRRAFKWAKKGAEQGDADAMVELARCFRVGLGTKRDEDAELEWLLKAAELGEPTARFCAGAELVTREEFSRARELLLAAFDEGDADAAFQLARCEWNDPDGDPEAVVRWAKLGTKNGDAGAWGILGLCAWHGAGLPRSPEKARRCWRNGSKLGDPQCDELLKNPPEPED